MKPRLKLLMTADAVGGIWNYAIELCGALTRHGVDVVLATLGPPPDTAQREQASRIGTVRLVCADYRLEWMADSSEDVRRAGDWLLQLAKEESVDLVHLNGYAHAALPWTQPILVVAHSCVGTWWRAVHGQPPPAPQWDSYLHGVATGLCAADCVVAPTEAFLRELTAVYGPLPRTRIIPNACSAEHLSADPSLERLSIIFACGRLWDEAKRLKALDAIAGDLPWPVYIAGDAASPDGRTAAAENATLLGRLSAQEIGSFMQRASVFVHPACYEPFGLAVLEAAQAGCALLLSDLPSLRELWNDAAEFVDAGNPSAFHQALLELIAQPERRIELARAAKARAAQFCPAQMGGTYAALYCELLQRHHSRQPVPHTETAAA